MTVVMESSSKLILQTKASRWAVPRERRKKQQRRGSAVMSRQSHNTSFINIARSSVTQLRKNPSDGMKNNTRNLMECLSIAVNVISFTFSFPTEASVLTILSSIRRKAGVHRQQEKRKKMWMRREM